MHFRVAGKAKFGFSWEFDKKSGLTGVSQSQILREVRMNFLSLGENYALIEQRKQRAEFPDAQEINTLDGLRIEYVGGFVLARPSNTTPVVVLRFEANNAAALRRS